MFASLKIVHMKFITYFIDATGYLALTISQGSGLKHFPTLLH